MEQFNLPNEMQSAKPDFFRATEGPESVSFFPRTASEYCSVIQVSYAGPGQGPNKRNILLRLRRQVHSPSRRVERLRGPEAVGLSKELIGSLSDEWRRGKGNAN